jgi:hypothetical protein
MQGNMLTLMIKVLPDYTLHLYQIKGHHLHPDLQSNQLMIMSQVNLDLGLAYLLPSQEQG